jgi:hypothetical protein
LSYRKKISKAMAAVAPQSWTGELGNGTGRVSFLNTGGQRFAPKVSPSQAHRGADFAGTMETTHIIIRKNKFEMRFDRLLNET